MEVWRDKVRPSKERRDYTGEERFRALWIAVGPELKPMEIGGERKKFEFEEGVAYSKGPGGKKEGHDSEEQRAVNRV